MKYFSLNFKEIKRKVTAVKVTNMSPIWTNSRKTRPKATFFFLKYLYLVIRLMKPNYVLSLVEMQMRYGHTYYN